jgi:O-Antigen ligase
VKRTCLEALDAQFPRLVDGLLGLAAASCSLRSSRRKAAALCWACSLSCSSSEPPGSVPRQCSSQGSSLPDWRSSPLRRSRVVKSVAVIRGVDESPEGRLIAWETAWNMAKARPLTGVGLANTVENYYFYSPIWQDKNKAMHSLWLRVLAETGFPENEAKQALAPVVALPPSAPRLAWERPSFARKART